MTLVLVPMVLDKALEPYNRLMISKSAFVIF